MSLFVAGAVQGIAAIAQAFAVSALVVALVRQEAWTTPAAYTLAAFAVRGLAAGATEILAARTGAQVSGEIRRRVLAELLGRDAARRDGSARMLTLSTQGATSIEPYVARYLPALANAAILPPAAILTMLLLDLPTGLIPVLTVPLLPLFAALIGAATAEATGRRWRTLAHLSGHFLDVMRGLPTLVTYGRARRQTETIREVSHRHRLATVETLKLAFVSSAALELLATISVAIVAVWVGIQLAEGDMDLALAMPLILLAPEAYWPIRRVGAEFHNAADGAAALDEVLVELDAAAPARGSAGAGSGTATAETAAESGAEAGTAESGAETAAADTGAAGSALPASSRRATEAGRPTAVRLNEVSYGYIDGVPVLTDLSDTLPSPGLTVITGPSGGGKTTLLEILAGLRTPDSGSVEAPPAHLVTQRPFLTEGTLRENLLLGVPRSPERPLTDGHLRKTLSDVGLAEMLRAMPLNLNTPVGDDGFGLSAGQRARIALARAILADPEMLILDEPTAHLDAEAEALIESVITGLADTRPVIAVTHRHRLVERADHHLVLGEHV